ncbi:MAG: O-antigen ligase family protein [Anaerolineae bacterium]
MDRIAVRQRLRALASVLRRPGIQLALTLLVAFGCALLAASLWRDRQAWPARSTTPLANPLANLNDLGTTVDLAHLDPEVLDSVTTELQQAGFRWVRQPFPWDEIEPRRGELDWSRWDAIVGACAAHQLSLIAVLDRAPAWARPASSADALSSPPGEVAEWGAWVARLATRYRGRIAAYQLWDEPNLAAHWGGLYVDPVAYAGLLREGAIRIHDADPGATVLFAALAPTLEPGPLNLNDVDFLRRTLDAGATPFFDALAVQPYGFGLPPDAVPDPAVLNFRRVELLRRELVARGLGDRPAWAVAGGWYHLPDGWEGDPGLWPNVTEQQQLDYTAAALRLARERWPWMGPILLNPLQPDRPATDPYWGFALWSAAGTPTPLYQQLAAYASPPQPLYSGVYRPRAAGVDLTGEWRFSSAGADPPQGASLQARNAILAFDVVGSTLDLTVRRGDFWGVLYISIDGAPAPRLPRDEQGRSYLVLYDPAGRVDTVPLASGLSMKQPHRIEIVADGGWGQWPLVGWRVTGPQQLPPSLGAIWTFAALAFAGVVSAGAQLFATPGLRRPLYAGLDRAFRWYRSLPEWIPITATLVTALAFYFLPWAPGSLLLLALLFVLVFLRIDLGLAVVAFSLPFYLLPKALGGRSFSVVELGVAVCLGAWLLARLLDWERSRERASSQPFLWRLQALAIDVARLPARLWRSWSALDKGMLALLFVALLSLRWTAHLAVAYRELRTVIVESTLFYALIRLAARSARARQRVVEGWLLGAVTISLVGLTQLVAGQNLIQAEGVWRVRGFYGSPNNLALYLERALPVLLAMAWQGQRGHGLVYGRVRLIYALAALPVLAALVLTLSKGALLLGLPAALLTLGLVQRKRRAIWIAVGAVVVLALLVAPFAATERFRSVLNLRSGTAFYRLKLWRATLSMLADRPFTGVGMDNYLYAYRSRYVLPSAWGELDLSHPHNLILDAWTRLGLPGLAVVGWLCYAFFRAAYRQMQITVGTRYALQLGLLAAWAGALAHGMVDQALFLPDLALAFALMAAMVGSS